MKHNDLNGIDVGFITETPNTGRAEKTVWVGWNDGVSIELRYVPMDEADKYREEAAVYKDHPKLGRVRIDSDAVKFNVTMAKAAVRNWKGIHLGGEAFPCTPENIALLARKWPEFAEFVNVKSTRLRELVAAEEEEKAKKSEATSGHEKTSQG